MLGLLLLQSFSSVMGKLLSQLMHLSTSLVPKHWLYLASRKRARTKCQLLRDNKMESQLCRGHHII